MFLKAASRYVRAKHVHHRLFLNSNDQKSKILANFLIESFWVQVSQRSRDRLLDHGLTIATYIDALAAVAVFDELEPKQVLSLFLESRKSWISQVLGTASAGDASSLVVSILYDVLGIIQAYVTNKNVRRLEALDLLLL